MRFSGFPAFILWAFVHLFYLVGWGNRLGTVTRWMWSLFARNRREQVISVTSLASSPESSADFDRFRADEASDPDPAPAAD